MRKPEMALLRKLKIKARIAARKGACRKCGSCCKAYVEKVDLKLSYSEREYLSFHRIEVKKSPKGETYLIFPLRCKHLTKDNKCAIYDKRPKACRDGPLKDFSFLHGTPCGFHWKKDKKC